MSFPKLELADCVLVVVDVQSRLMQAMAAEDSAAVVENTARMIRGAQLLDVPVLLTEQYPKGLGPTVDEILALLPEDTLIRDKLDFSCLQVQGFAPIWSVWIRDTHPLRRGGSCVCLSDRLGCSGYGL